MHPTTSAQEAADALAAGHLVALPTETVYGLGANAEDPLAVARIFTVKGRPIDHPLIVHLAGIDAVPAWAKDVRNYAVDLMHAFWPGPMTLVLPASGLASEQLTGGQPSIGLRISRSRDFQAVMSAFTAQTHTAAGIAAPSANRFGKVSPTTAQHVLDELGDFMAENDLVFDAGPCAVGVESTIIDCTGDAPVILRSGAITRQDIETVTQLRTGTQSSVRASGTLDVHYAPQASVHIINESELAQVPAGSGFLALAKVPTPDGCLRILAPETTEAFAHGLYASLREVDARGLNAIYIVTPPASGIGIAINDRVDRAAAATSAASEGQRQGE